MIDLSRFIGIPYQPRGRSWEGVDCYGLALLFHQSVNGITIPGVSEIYSDPTQFKSINALIQKEKSQFIAVENPLFGDIITLRISHFVAHLGIYIDESTMLHSLEGHDSAIERLDSHSWKHRIAGYYRPPGI